MKEGDDNEPPEVVGDGPAEELKYEVGYKRPPKATRFKKGQSGNPSGRPRRPFLRSLTTLEVMQEPIEITQGRKRIIVTGEEGVMRVLRNKALGGDLRAIKQLMELLHKSRPHGEEATRYLQGDTKIQVNLIESPHNLEKKIAKPDEKEKDEDNRKK
jgi:hypothetical protein